MANIKKLKANGQDIVPITHEQAVLDSNGVTLESKLNAINNAISQLQNNSTSNTPSLEGNTLTFGNYTITYNETNDTLDFIYNGVIDNPGTDEPTIEEIVLKPTWTDNMNLSSSDGSANSQSGTMITDFITLESGYNYSLTTLPPTNATGIRIYFYDSSKTYISRTEDAITNTWVNNVATDINSITPSNAAYMRFKSNSIDGVTASNANTYIVIKKTLSYIKNGLSLFIDAQDVTTQGSIRDITGKQNITNHGVPTTLDNGCLNFVSTESDYIDCGFKPNLTQWSAEAYFYFTTTPTGAETLLGWGASGNRTAIGFWGNTFMIAINGNVEHTITSTAPTSLTHLVLTYNNGTIIGYVNGIKSQVASGANVMSSQAGNLMIGTKYSASGEFGNIHVKSLRFYDGKVLSDEEALQNYNYETNRNSEPGTGGTTQEEIIPLTWAVGNLSSTGAEKDQANALRSSFAAIEDNYDYTFYMDNSMYDPSGVRVYFYDTNKTYISRTDGNTLGYTSGTNISIDIPTNAAYMRFKANASGTTSVDTIGSLFTLRKTLK